MDAVKQDWVAVASVLEHTLRTIKIQLPRINTVYLRSDNAGCYHCGSLWLAIPKITETTGKRNNVILHLNSDRQTPQHYNHLL